MGQDRCIKTVDVRAVLSARCFGMYMTKFRGMCAKTEVCESKLRHASQNRGMRAKTVVVILVHNNVF